MPSSFVYHDSSSDRTPSAMCWNQYIWMSNRRERRRSSVGIEKLWCLLHVTVCYCLCFFIFFFPRKCYLNHYINVYIYSSSHLFIAKSTKKNMTDRFSINCWNQRNFYEWIRLFEWDVRFFQRNNSNNFFSRLLLFSMGNVLYYVVYNNVLHGIVQQPSNWTIRHNDAAVHFTFNECYRFIYFFKHVKYVCAYINSMRYMEIMLFVYMWEKFIK